MDAQSEIKSEEALRLVVYDDATGKPIGPGSAVVGHPTIGYGRALDVRGITRDEAEMLFQHDYIDVTQELTQRLPWTKDLSAPRLAVLVSMAFNMGVIGLLGFHITLDLIKTGQYEKAADAMLDSVWAKQVPARAKQLSEQMRTGTWQ